MKLFPTCCVLAALWVPVAAAEAPSVPAAKSPAPPPPATTAPADDTEHPRFEFSLLPKSLQRNPSLEITVMGEVTEEGKKLPPVSPESPAYFTLFSAGYHAMGDDMGEKTLQQDDIERILTRSLATNGYLPAKAPRQPSLLVVYVWGSHNRVTDSTEDPGVKVRNFLERVALVGGEKFAAQAVKMLEEQADQQNMGVPPEVLAFIDPLHRYEMSSTKHAYMLDQARSEVYYVVASAYDYALVAKKQRRLLWRTRMTVDSMGVNQTQTLPTLIVKAGPVFGKATEEPEILTPHVRDGQVEIGIPRVVGEEPAEKPAGGPPPVKK